jgi:hypothetical protein
MSLPRILADNGERTLIQRYIQFFFTIMGISSNWVRGVDGYNVRDGLEWMIQNFTGKRDWILRNRLSTDLLDV